MKPRLPLHPGLSLPSDATLSDPAPQPKEALDSRATAVASSDTALPQPAQNSKQHSSKMAVSQSAQIPMGPTSGNVRQQKARRPKKSSRGAVVTQPVPNSASLATTRVMDALRKKRPIYTHKIYQGKETPVHWTERQPLHGVHIDVQRIPPDFREGRIVRRNQMDNFLRTQEVVSCDVIWPERDEDNLLNFHCWLDFSSKGVKKIMESKLQEIVFVLGVVYEFQDSAVSRTFSTSLCSG